MKRLMAVLLCLLCIPAAGCIVVDKPGHGHGHGRRYYGHPSHVHCVGCGHVSVKGVWYFER